MSKKHAFLHFFSKITIFACVFCAFFIPSAFATLPTGYTELEYIESTGTQYIDTGIKPSIALRTDITLSYTVLNAENMVFGVSTSGGYATGVNYVLDYYQNKPLLAFGDGAGTGGQGGKSKLQTNTKYNFTLNINGDATLYLDGVAEVTSTKEKTFPDYSIFLFGRSVSGVKDSSSNYWFQGKIYYFKLTNENIVVRNMIPAKRNSDNVLGMYDTVSGTFFTNQGTGDFIAGPDAIIKIATTKFVDDEFAPLDTALENAINVVDNVVTQTIAQAGQIATLQNTKQTRPDDDNECPANMKCLLVTDESGTPHWYPIIEP